MEKALVIVESPAKAKTIRNYLGKQYNVTASVGHIKDLPRSKIGVDVENDFEPQYEVIRGKNKIIKEVKKEAKSVDVIYLAPDPDREGEAIAWHIAEELKKTNKNIKRIVFNEITKNAVKEAIKNPRSLNEELFASYQARRILDRLVGYQISPILWDKVRRGLSAGRVQSVALRIVVEREREIKAFIPVEYWKVHANFEAHVPPQFEAKVTKFKDKPFKDVDGDTAKEAAQHLKKATCKVQKIEKKERKRKATAPLITSKLQQLASSQLRFSARKTMMIAQRLYEGIDVGGEGAVGLITYMRTDSTRVSDEALTQVRKHIKSEYGAKYLPDTPNMYKTKKSAQDAHEAIRPTSMERTPESIAKYLDKDQNRLYRLIWKHFVASQMTQAVFDQTAIIISSGDCELKANGSILRFDGYTAVLNKYEESAEKESTKEDDDQNASDQNKELPMLEEGEQLKTLEVKPTQHFTQPPPRYSEGTLIKELEDKGIGRPSTYATILSVIVDKEYVEKNQGRFNPTDLGTLVSDLLVESFPEIMDVAFTAGMEDKLDSIADGTAGWVQILKDFYKPFEKTLAHAQEHMRDVKREQEPTDLKCERCESTMVIRWGRNGYFLACSNYPECKNTKEFKRLDDGTIEIVTEEESDEVCEQCGKSMIIKRGRFGKFLACSGYPDCKNARPLPIGVNCPKDECKGYVTERRSKRGRTFYGCSEYPNCDFVSWAKPVNETCPDCGSKYLLVRESRDGKVYRCPVRECKYERPAD